MAELEYNPDADYNMVHKVTRRDIKKAEGIALGCRMNIAIVEFKADEYDNDIMRLERIVLTDNSLNLTGRDTHKNLFWD